MPKALPINPSLILITLEDLNLLSDMSITLSRVSNIICNLDPHKSCGPYGMSVIIIKICAPEIASVILKCIINTSLPRDCLLAPDMKNTADSSGLSNYRNIRFLLLLGKFLYALIDAELIHHFSSQGFSSEKQYGFRLSR